MESEVCVEKTSNKEDSSGETVPMDTVSDMEVENDEASKVGDGTAALEPPTHDPDGDNGETILDYNNKFPSTWASPPSRIDCPSSCRMHEDPGSDLSPETPKDDVFDPFAPGPDELMDAPRKKNFDDESRNKVVRRLSFDFSSLELKGVAKLDDFVES